MALTPRWGFRAVGGDLGGTILDDDSRYTSNDRQVLDRVLAYLEGHRHEGGERLRDPLETPTAELLNTGALPGAATFYYVVSFIDRYGLESAPSPEVALATPLPPARPTAPSAVSAADGTLAPGSYAYGLTRVLVTGEQTPLSDTTVVTLGDDDGSVVIELPDVNDNSTAGFNVWRQGPSEAGPTNLGLATGDTYTDDGHIPPDDCACDPYAAPPTQDITLASSSIKIELGDLDSDLVTKPQSLVSKWRIYRSTTSGGQRAGSLLVEVVATDDAGALVTSYTDNGSEPLKSGQPTSISQTLTPSVEIKAGGGGSGGGHIEDPILVSIVTGEPVRVSVDADGTLTSTTVQGFAGMLGTQYAIGHGPVLTSPAGKLWRLGLTNDDSLRTESVIAARTNDVVKVAGAGPLCQLLDTLAYRIEVDDDGALTTVLDSSDAATSFGLTDSNGSTWNVTAPETGTQPVVTGGS